MSSEESPTHIGSVEDEVTGYVGPYKLLQLLGEGGMGTVYMAEQEHPVRRRVALKVIKPGMDSRQVIARFEAERQALALMDHQNIAKVLDAGSTDDDRPYVVMELVPGISITDYCDRNRFTLKDRLRLFIPVCRAIQHAHQKGIIHRDIKPSNILVTMYDGKPVPKVIDFGLAKALQQRLTERTMFTQFGQVVGTLEYMSPEQAEMNALDIDTRTDVYSLGVLLYELMTGTTPLQKQTIKEKAFDRVLQIIREEDPPKPSSRLSESTDTLAEISAQRRLEPSRLNRMLRGDLDWAVMKALDKDRNRRYDTASNFADDIERYLANEPILARPPSTTYKLQKLVRRNFAIVITSLTLLTLLLVAVFVSIWFALAAHNNLELAEERLKQAQAATITAKAAKLSAETAVRVAESERDRARAAVAQAKADVEGTSGMVGGLLAPGSASSTPTTVPVAKSQDSIIEKATEFLGANEAEALAQTAMKLPGTSGALSAGYSLFAAASQVAQLREAEKSLTQLISVQREKEKVTGSTIETQTALSTYLNLLANLQLSERRYEEAEASARESMQRRQKVQPDSWRYFETSSALGDALSHQKRYREAEKALRDAWVGLNKTSESIPDSVRHKRLIDTANRLVQLFEAQGNADGIDEWKAEAAKLSAAAGESPTSQR